MARITLLSFLFALVILLPLATSTAALASILINKGSEGWAKSLPARGPPPFISPVVIDKNNGGEFEYWDFEPHEDGFRIKTMRTGYWLTTRHGEVVAASAFNQAAKWEVQGREMDFAIKVPNEDLFMTARQGKDGGQITIFLEPSDGSMDQKWSLQPIEGE
ncbi:hypothetical protein BGZ76_007359 [Entomortierella beljakovae]|nr:hypothetical protein BGZ76_007359 [Entomortierella beljakovae]